MREATADRSLPEAHWYYTHGRESIPETNAQLSNATSNIVELGSLLHRQSSNRFRKRIDTTAVDFGFRKRAQSIQTF